MMQEDGERMMALIRRLFPICRSITGNGVRQTLRILQEVVPLQMHEVPSGTEVFDWIVPKEWNIEDAYIKDSRGRRLVDFQASNLHVVSYSTPIYARLKLNELNGHLFTLPEHPHWIPYRTSYYKESWGFCLTEEQLQQFHPEEEYEVGINSSLANGSLTYGEYFLPGEIDREVLISCHICHPSLANDNLSGIAVAVELARTLSASKHRYSYRFLFIPGTIGAITWLALHESELNRITHGVVLTSVGDAASLTYKRSRHGNAEIDRAFLHCLQESGKPYNVLDFSPYGYDERQYGSPGINIPAGCLMRSVHGTFPEYHSSADNLDFVRSESLAETLTRCLAVIDVIENNKTYLNRKPKGEPQLGKRGLYEGLAGSTDQRQRELAILWVLNLSDGRHSLLDIAERSKLSFSVIKEAATALAATDLLSQL